MKLEQKREFTPITVTLEKESEAYAFFNLVDKLENYRCNENQKINFTPNETSFLIQISNARTKGDVTLWKPESS